MKNKNKIFIILGVLGILGILGGLGWVFKDKFIKPKKITPPLGVNEKKKEFNFDWALWEDPAGFSFEYPRELNVNVHPEDENNYSFLTLSSENREGKLDVVCNDSQYKNLDEWLEKDSLIKQGSGMETKVASLSAQKVALVDGREITGFIDWDEVIYIIDKSSESEDKSGDIDYWQEVYNHVLDTFKLIPLEGESEEEFVQWVEDFNTVGMDVVESVEIIE